MSGRRKTKAALSAEGTCRTPVVILYEGIFLRDHWSEVTEHPWWDAFSEDVDVMVAVKRDDLSKAAPDWAYGGACLARAVRKNLSIEKRAERLRLYCDLTRELSDG